MTFTVQQVLMPFTPDPLLNTNVFVNIRVREKGKTTLKVIRIGMKNKQHEKINLQIKMKEHQN